MPRYRKLHTKTVESFDFNEMPDDFTRLLWVLLPLGCSREGTLPYSATLVRSKLFPLREDVTIEQISAALAWFRERAMILLYKVDGRDYLFVPTFARYQGNTVKESASDYPPPPQELLTNSGPTPDLLRTNSSTDAICTMQYTDAIAISVPFPEIPEQEANKAIGKIWTEHTKTMISAPILGDFREIATDCDGKLEHYGLHWLDDMLARAVLNCNGPPTNPGKYLRAMAKGWEQQGYGGGGGKWQSGRRRTVPEVEPEEFVRGRAFLETLTPS